MNNIDFEPVFTNLVPHDQLVIGLEMNGKAKAYPVEYLAYHHQVDDSLANKPVLVTYCIMCRSGRVFDPVIDGKRETFKLIGTTQYNAILEDASSESWWQQATGVAIAGEKKGTQMKEIFSEQMALSVWIRKHPNTLILQPDTNFTNSYCMWDGFTIGFGHINSREGGPWGDKFWIIGVVDDKNTKAFDYTTLMKHRLLEDSVGSIPILVALERDTISYHVWNRRVNNESLSFQYCDETGEFRDVLSQSVWNMNGICTSGEYKGEELKEVQSYIEFWHSWESFYPETEKGQVYQICKYFPKF